MADHISALLCLHVRALGGVYKCCTDVQRCTKGNRFNSYRLSELGVQIIFMPLHLHASVCVGGIGCVYIVAHVKNACKFGVRVDSLRVGCAVSPEGCSPCLWGIDSPH